MRFGLLAIAMTVYGIPLIAAEAENNSPACTIRTVHVIVALCDNKHQGIVPVPAKLGNGQDPANNLYWGALYGVKTFFTKSPEWTRINVEENAKANPAILDRVVFYQKSTHTYLVAEAYDGAKMKEAIEAFLYPGASTLELNGNLRLKLGRDADLRAFVGHDGLMEINLPKRIKPEGLKNTPAIVLACLSRKYFEPYFESAGLWNLLTTKGLMAPEAYTLEAAVSAWAENRSVREIRSAGSKAYAKYQKIKISAAENLFTGSEPPATSN
ncbi:MAG: hypothetical protein JXR97_05565 [Planctomycetes bacterium]|nr:hypothetical protein [Planctomycetota bacterium]